MNEIATEIITQGNLYAFALIFLWISFISLFAIMGFMFKGKGSKWGTFWEAWLFSAILTGLITTFFIMSPEQISQALSNLKEAIK